MPDTRRSRLARRLVAATDLTYQQALDLLDRYTTAGNPLPRTAEDLAALAAQPPEIPGSPATTSAEIVALLEALTVGTPATFTRHSTTDAEPEPVELVVAALGELLDASYRPVGTPTIGLAVPDVPDALTWLILDDQATLTRSSDLARVIATADGEPATCEFRLGARRPLRSADKIVRVRDWVMRMSDIGRCPAGSMSARHYLPDGTCAHAKPVCPTCAGVGLLADGTTVIECRKHPNMPYMTPVCNGTGYWEGTRT